MAEATTFLDELQKECGLSDENHDVTQWLSTGLPALNRVCSGRHSGGIPVGRITEIYGWESTGKTALATVAMVETQKLGGFCVFLDFEHSFSTSRARAMGLNTDPEYWLYKQPNVAEEAFAFIERIIGVVRKHDQTRMVTIVVDSIASMVTKSMQETAFGDEKMNTMISLSRVMSAALPKIARLINKSQVTLIILNQLREKVSTTGMVRGEQTKTPGGNATKFFGSVRIQLSKVGKIEEKTEIIGERIEAVGKKNKVAPPLVKCQYINIFETGVDFIGSNIEYACSLGIMESSGGWIGYRGKKWRLSGLVEYFRDNREEYDKFITESFKD